MGVVLSEFEEAIETQLPSNSYTMPDTSNCQPLIVIADALRSGDASCCLFLVASLLATLQSYKAHSDSSKLSSKLTQFFFSGDVKGLTDLSAQLNHTVFAYEFEHSGVVGALLAFLRPRATTTLNKRRREQSAQAEEAVDEHLAVSNREALVAEKARWAQLEAALDLGTNQKKLRQLLKILHQVNAA